MARIALTASLLFLVTFPLPAQQSMELLQSVGQGQAQRLEEYNYVFLQEELYFASRHRIVRANINVLLQERDIAVTPFEDVKPIRLIHESLMQHGGDAISWLGHLNYPEDDQLFKQTGVGIPAHINLFAWDTDDDGNAVISSQNRFEFSPEWKFDESGNLITDEDVIASTPPPTTPAEIERHKRLQRLDKHAFYSATAVFEVPGGSKYVLRPLQYTPRYSVIYEITPDTIVPVRIDRAPGEPDTRTAYEVTLFNRYREFVRNLPKEENKQVRGDIP